MRARRVWRENSSGRPESGWRCESAAPALAEDAFVECGWEATLQKMDRVRFGRALGFGARQAVKTLVTAVDAATAENPSARGVNPSANTGYAGARGADATAGAARSAKQAATPAVAEILGNKSVQKAAQAAFHAREVQQGLGRGSRRLGESIWKPFVRLSGVLWLEVSGVFFGVFALLALGYMWKLRGAWRGGPANAASHRSLMGAAVMLALFGYFCVSSFVRARRRERGR